MPHILTLSACLALACLAILDGVARADEPAPRGPPRVIELEALTIEGRVAKPQVFYVLGRSRIEYENLKMQRVFVDRIVETAKKSRF
jgi:hypothetical protein